MTFLRLLAALLALSIATQAKAASSYVMPIAGPLSMADFVDDYLNPGLLEIARCHAGSAEPTNGPSSAAAAGQCWWDTTTTTWINKTYDGTTWIETGRLDISANTFAPSGLATNLTGLPVSTGISGLGTGVATALAVNVGSAGAPVVNGGALGTPSSGTATNITGLPVSTGISGLGTGIATALAVNTGSAGAPVLFNGALGTPSSGTATNITGLPISTGVSGLGTGVATALAVNVGSAGAPVVNGGALGTPSSGTATNITGLPVSSGISGLGTGIATALAVNTGSAGAPVLFNGALGTPTSGTATNITGLPISTGVSGLGTGVATWAATPSSANLRAALTDETGTGAAVFATAPTISDAVLTGLVDLQGAIKYSTQSAPAQIAANQNDYNPSSVVCASTTTLLINADAARDITGIAGGAAGCSLRLINNGSFTITLKEQDAGSAAANRFNTGGDFALAANGGVTLVYDGVASRWRNENSITAGAGSGTVTSVVCGTGLSGGTITTSGTCSINLGNANTWTATQNFAAATFSGDVTFDSTLMFVDAANNYVSFGTTAQVIMSSGTDNGATFWGNILRLSANADAALAVRRHTSDGATVRFYRDTAQVGRIDTASAGTTTYVTSSDGRLKGNRKAIADEIDVGSAIIDKTQIVAFNWLDRTGKPVAGAKRDFGVIAQDAFKVLPQAVSVGSGNPGDEDFAPWGVDYSKYVPALIAELQSLRRRVAELEKAK